MEKLFSRLGGVVLVVHALSKEVEVQARYPRWQGGAVDSSRGLYVYKTTAFPDPKATMTILA
jgi:hypothetical protein